MENKTNFKCWNFEVHHYVPTTPIPGGDIEWVECGEYHEVFLPADITDPEKYLQDLKYENDMEFVGYGDFSEIKVE